MACVRVKPVNPLCLEEFLDTSDLEKGEGVLSRLSLDYIEVNPQTASWNICFISVDRDKVIKSASGIYKDDFDVILAKLGHEIRKRVNGLEKVYFKLDFDPDKVFKKREVGRPKKEKTVLFGKGIKTKPVPVSSVTGGERENVTIKGKIVDVLWKQTQSQDTMGQFIISDGTDSINARVISKEGKIEGLESGEWVTLRGRTRMDRYDLEPVIFCNDICLAESPVRCDTAPIKRVELHLHSKMSQLDSTLSLEDVVKRAKKWDHPAIAVTDHGVVQAFPEAYRLGQEHGIKILYGVEAYLVDDIEPKGPSYHIILLARNKKGLRNLYELVTESHLKYFYRTPRIPRSLLLEKRDGLILGSACESGEIFKAILSGASDDKLLDMAKFYDYLEIQPLDNNGFLISDGSVESPEELMKINKKIYWLANEISIPCVMTCDVHYLDPEDEIFRTLLLSGKGMNEGEKSTPLYYRTTNEMLEEAASYLSEEQALEVVVKNPVAISHLIEPLRPVLEGSYFPSLDNAEETLKDLTLRGAKERYGDELPDIVSRRLERELGAIIGNGFASLYLIAIRMVEKSMEKGYLVGSRGSVGSSLVATCTGITEVNPLMPHYVCPSCYWTRFVEDESYASGFDLPDLNCPECGHAVRKDGQDIPFETFMGFDGEKVPDIDLNFSGEVQGEIFKFASQLLGEKNVYRAGTIATVGKKTAFGFVKHYAQDREKTFRKAEEVRLAKGIEGIKRTTGQHPGGIMVIPKGMDVMDFTPLQYPADDRNSGAITTHFDYHSISGHLVKVDILGHDDPTVLKMLHEITGVDPTTVPMNDPETLNLFSGERVDDVVGIPEFGTRFVRGMLADTKPQSFAGLVRISGLSHGTDVWANNARDLIRNDVASLDQVIATREDIFLFLIKKGMDPAVAFRIAEIVRKGNPLSASDIDEMKKVTVSDWYIDSCKKITYLFPKSHAAAYVTTAFRIAWFKVHYPVAFYAAYFSFHGSSLTTDVMYKTVSQWQEYIQNVEASSNATTREQDIASALEIALEMVGKGITFDRPSLYKSHANHYIPDGNMLIPPFTSIPGLGASAATAIINARQAREFTSIEDFRRCTGLSKKICDVLSSFEVFGNLPPDEQLSLFQ